MAVVESSFLVVAALLVVAGGGKLRSPVPTARAMAAIGLPGSPHVARALGVVEILVGGAALLFGGRLAALALAVAYAMVTVVAILQRSRGQDCGCFGTTPAAGATVTGLHVTVDAAATVVAVLAALSEVTALRVLPALTPATSIAVLAMLATGVVLLRAALVRLPDLWAAESLHAPVVAS